MIVVDASSWVVALLDASHRGDAARRVLAGDTDWAAPTHAVLEVLRTVRRYEVAGVLTQEAATTFATEVQSAQVRYHAPDRPLLDFVWRHRHNFSPYDAPYVAIAQLFAVPLVTHDQRLARAARALGTTVVVP